MMTTVATDAGQLFEAHKDLAAKVVNVLCRRLPRHVDRLAAENAALLAMWQAAGRFDPTREVAFETFAGRRMAGAVLDMVRQEAGSRRRGPRRRRLALTGAEVGATGIDHLLPWRERTDVPLRVLSAQQRRAVELCYGDGLTQVAAAAVLGVGESRVSQLLKQAVAELRLVMGVAS